MRKAFNSAVLVVLVAIGVSVGWLVFGEVRTSEAARFDESVNLVHHQTARISGTLADTRAVMKEDISSVTDISELLARWTPKYDAANAAYLRFHAAINLAEERAEAYFAAHRAFTERYHDPVRKAQRQAHDDAVYAGYVRWRDQAHRTRADARSILNRLDDMDTDLQKLKLSTEMTFDVGGFSDVPVEITDLEAELAEFQTASDNIRELMVSPFAEGS